jgi:hypothetical protein
MEILKGNVAAIGEFSIDGESIIGIFVECTKENLKKIPNIIFSDVEVRVIKADK